eukprot:3615175-Pleurochrysis_carterae.AAC.1
MDNCQVAGSRPCVLPLEQALEALGINWTPVDGARGADAALAALPHDGATGGAARDDGMWALRAPGEDEATTWARAGLLCTVGLMPSLDGARVSTEDVAQFVAAAGGNQAAAGA